MSFKDWEIPERFGQTFEIHEVLTLIGS